MIEHSATKSSNRNYGDCEKHQGHMAPDGEYVCVSCGTVLSSYDDLQEGKSNNLSITTTPAQKSHINLFLAHELGSSRVKDLPDLSTRRSLEIAYRDTATRDKNGKKSKRGTSIYLSRFSNACSKLSLTPAEAEYAWQLFVKLYKELGKGGDNGGCARVNTSEIACYALAAGAATTTQGMRLLNEAALVGAVRFSFHTKVVRDMYYVRRVIETRTQTTTKIAVKPVLTASAKWMRGRY